MVILWHYYKNKQTKKLLNFQQQNLVFEVGQLVFFFGETG